MTSRRVALGVAAVVALVLVAVLAVVLVRSGGPDPVAGPDVGEGRLGDQLEPYSTTPADDVEVATTTEVPDWSDGTATTWQDSDAFDVNGVPQVWSPERPELGGQLLTAGAGLPKSWDVRFTFTGERLALAASVEEGGQYQVWVDGRPVAAEPTEVPGGLVFADLDLGERRTVEIRFAGPYVFAGVLHDEDAVLEPSEPPHTIGVVSDSWYESLPEHLADSAPVHLASQTGWRVWNMSQGGTGYTNGSGLPGQSVFGSPQRLAVLEEAPIDLLLVNGSGNDVARDPAQYEKDVTAYLAAVGRARPGLPVVVAGIEPVSAFRTDQGEALNDALRRAAQAAPNVVGFIDAYEEGWLTGTGNVDAAAGDGNQDTMIAADTYHLSGEGARYWVERTVEALADLPAVTTAPR